MPLWKNFTPGDLPASGLLIPEGTARHDTARMILDEIVDKSGGAWLEVTDAAPTPAALHPFASTLEPGGIGYTDSDGAPLYHGTLYYANDTQLPGAARLLRIGVGRYGWVLLVTDLSCIAAPDTNGVHWEVLYSGWGSEYTYTCSSLIVSSAGGTNASVYDLLMYNPTVTGTGDTTFSTLQVDCRLFLAGGSDWLALKTIRATDGHRLGGNVVFCPAAPSDGHWNRTNAPAILGLLLYGGNFEDGATTSSSNITECGLPGVEGQIAGWSDLETFAVSPQGFNAFADNLTPSGELLLTPVVCGLEASDRSVFYGQVPGLLRSARHTAFPLYSELAVGSSAYVCLATPGYMLFVQTG